MKTNWRRCCCVGQRDGVAPGAAFGRDGLALTLHIVSTYPDRSLRGDLHGLWHCLLPAACLLGVTRVCELMWHFEYINHSRDKSKDKFPEITLGLTLASGSVGIFSITHVLVRDKVKLKVLLGFLLVRLSP